MNLPKLAMCNFISDVSTLRRFALANGFAGVDWTLKVEDLPENPLDESRLLRRIAHLQPLEVRYHLAFQAIDLGDAESARAESAMDVFRRACALVSRLNGRYHDHPPWAGARFHSGAVLGTDARGPRRSGRLWEKPGNNRLFGKPRLGLVESPGAFREAHSQVAGRDHFGHWPCQGLFLGADPGVYALKIS